MTPGTHGERIRHTFDSFCKRVLKREAINIQQHMKWLNNREVTFSALSAGEMAGLTATDEYFTGAYTFDVFGESVGVTDADLAEALNAIPVERRDIVYRRIFLI